MAIRISTLASSIAVVALTGGLGGWMIAQIAEHPGVPREVELPPWFAGEPGAARKPAAEAERGPAAGHKAEVALAKPSALAPQAKLPPDDGFVQIAGDKVEIALTEYELKPGKIRVKPGTVTFVLRNEGRFSHDFHVEGPGVDAYAAKFSPGRTIRLEVTLQEGEYKISCPLSNHDQRGMLGTLVVSAKGG